MICFKCSKPFEPHSKSKRICQECFVERGSKFSEADRKRARYLKDKYGLEQEDYFYMLSAQGGCCAICLQPSEKPLVVDHDHHTMSVRGLLCYRCNTGIGFFKEDQAYLRRAVEYLNQHARLQEEYLQIAGNKSMDSRP